MTMFRKKFKSSDFGSKMTHFPHLGDNEKFLLKIKNGHFYPLFNVCHQAQFKKNPLTEFEISSKILVLVPKMIYLTHFEHGENFFKNRKLTFTQFLMSSRII